MTAGSATGGSAAGGAGGVWLRAARAADAPAIARLYVETVHAVNAADYSPSQIATWAAGGAEPAFWVARQTRLHTVVAVSAVSAAEAGSTGSAGEESEVIVGFCEYQAPAGAAPAPPIAPAAPPAHAPDSGHALATGDAHLDCLYVHHAWIGHGVGSWLLADLEAHARRDGAAGIWLEACITARPFFERRGYQALRRFDKAYRGESFTIFEMRRPLPPAPPPHPL